MPNGKNEGENMKRVLLLALVVLGLFGLAACGPTEEPPVEEATVTSLQIVTQPSKTEYQLNEAFSTAGLQVKAIYSDGTEKILTASELQVSGFSSTVPGSKTVTISFGGKQVTLSALVFDPNADRELIQISLTSLPNKQNYKVGETFVAEGLVVEAVYSTGDKENVTSYDLTGFVSSAIKLDGVATVTFEGKTATFPYTVRNTIVQGVTANEIVVGNTAAVSGPFAAVGVPFNAAIDAYFKMINAQGGVNGRQLKFVSYDDGFVGSVGLTYTKRLVEEDKIFALVGHFGTNTVDATLGYIQETGVPMVYAATGVNGLYFQESPLNPVMAVQPIYKTDGRIMTARALNESLYGPNQNQKISSTAKVGVLYTATLDGLSIKEGIEAQAAVEGRTRNMVYRSFSAADSAALNTAILDLISNGVQAVILASNQAPFKAAVNAMQRIGLTVPVFTSYVNADATSVDPTVNYQFPMYANAWVDIVDPEGFAGFSADYWFFATVMSEQGYPQYAANAFSMAGFIAADIFVKGLQRVGANELTWESYIKAMESEALNVPMAGTVDFTGGKRWGIASMALLKLDLSSGTPTWAKVRDIEELVEIQAK